MFALMLLEVPDVCGTVFTLITLVHHFWMILSMTNQVSFSHKTPFTACSHAHVSFYFLVSVFDFVLFQVTFKRILLTALVTNKLVSSCMQISVSL